MELIVLVFLVAVIISVKPAPYDEGIEDFYRTEYPHKYKNHFEDHLWRWFN